MKKFLAMSVSLILTAAMICGCSKASSDNGSTGSATGGAVAANGVVKVNDVDLTEEKYAFGVDKKQPELLKSANDFIKEIKENGKFDEICNHYFGGGQPKAVKSAKLDSGKDQLVVATNAAFEPFEYTKGDDYYGIDMEIAEAFAEKLGKELVIQNMDFDAVCLSVGQHKCDIAMAGLTVNEERQEYVNFSDTYYQASQRLIVKADDTTFDECKEAGDVEALLQKTTSSDKIGVQAGTTAQYYIEGSDDWDFAGLPAECVQYKNGSLAVQDLVNGNLKYVIIDAAPAACITEAINAMQ